jgi:hypothetical protein
MNAESETVKLAGNLDGATARLADERYSPCVAAVRQFVGARAGTRSAY